MIPAVSSSARCGHPAAARLPRTRLHTKYGLRLAAATGDMYTGSIIDVESGPATRSRPPNSESVELARLKAKLISAVAGAYVHGEFLVCVFWC